MRHIHKDQIDNDIWTIPAENMKRRRDATTEFRVPLSSEALKVIEQVRPLSRNDFFFSARGRGRGLLTANCMSQYIYNRLGLVSARMDFSLVYTIGSLKQPVSSYEVAETILSHTVGGTSRACLSSY